MGNKLGCVLAIVAMLGIVGSVSADDVTGAERLLCTAVTVIGCMDDGECASGPPWSLNIPQFIEIDLKEKTLNTTQASGQNRSTPIKNLERGGGMIVLQGYEMERAFSFLIVEKTGLLSIAVARDGVGVVVFGACTPIPSSR